MGVDGSQWGQTPMVGSAMGSDPIETPSIATGKAHWRMAPAARYVLQLPRITGGIWTSRGFARFAASSPVAMPLRSRLGDFAPVSASWPLAPVFGIVLVAVRPDP